MSLRPIYYDTETTGISPDRDRVIEIAAYDSVNDRSFVRLINPGCRIPAEATAIHKISNEMVADAPSFALVAEEFVQFCSGDVILIAHNNDAFDLHFLRNEFERNQLQMPSWRFLDSLKWARRYRPDLPRHTLQFLREMYGIVANNAHRALDDVLVLYQIFSKMTDDLNIHQICELLTSPSTREITHMPFGKYQNKPLGALPKDYVGWLASSGAFDKAENQPLKLALQKAGVLAL